MKKRLPLIAATTGALAVMGTITLFQFSPPKNSLPVQNTPAKATVADRLAQYGRQAQSRWQPFFETAGISYPPSHIILVGLKHEKKLDVYAANKDSRFRFVRTMPILAASGRIGPKLCYGDLQVPEGIYGIESLNPNSAFHLSLRVSYPSAQDRAQADSEGRSNLGGDIMIHGSNASVGCLAMGDEAAEDLFILAAQTGIEHIKLLLSPLDFRVSQVPTDPDRPTWVQKRYSQLEAALKKLPPPT